MYPISGPRCGDYVIFEIEHGLLPAKSAPFQIMPDQKINRKKFASWKTWQAMKKFRVSGGIEKMGICDKAVFIKCSKKAKNGTFTRDHVKTSFRVMLSEIMGSDIKMRFVRAKKDGNCRDCSECPSELEIMLPPVD